MQVRRLQDDPVVALPQSVVETLALKEGDEVVVKLAGDQTVAVRRESTRAEREAALDAIAALQFQLPPGYRFERKELYDDYAFFDTNVLVYAFVPSDRRYRAARELVAEGGTLSVQVLNELTNVLRSQAPHGMG